MKKNLYLIVISFIVLFTACNDFLDVDPNLRAKLETKEDVAKLLVNAYPKANPMLIMEVMSDNVADNQTWISPSLAPLVERNLYQSFWWEIATEEAQDTPTNFWNSCYEAIAHANLAIEFIEGHDNPDNFAAELGEALVCRAYAHFMLTVLFCKPYNPATAASDLGVPYPTDPEKETYKHYQRETLEKTYELIEKDLLRGLPLLDDANYKVRKYHFNKSAANAFASRFYLFKQDWRKAVDYANLSLGNSEVSLLRDWNGEYAGMTDRDREAIYTNQTEAANLLLTEAASWWPYYSYFRYIVTSPISSEIYGGGTKNVTGGYFVAMPNLKWNGGVDETFVLKLKGWERFTSIDQTSYYLYQMVTLFSAEEVLLNRAEGYAMLGKSDSVCHDLNIYYSKRIRAYNAATNDVTVDKINSFAQRYLTNDLSPVGYTMDNTNQMNQVKVIVDTRRKEFIHEGNRWYDIKRFNIEVTHTSYDKSKSDVLRKDDPRRELQIPTDALSFGITPNPR